MSRWARHFHRCPTCGKLRRCLLGCQLTDELIGGDGSDKPVGPRAHGGSGATPVGYPMFCTQCATYLDSEAVDLLLVLNRIPGLRTVESCCGHGRTAFQVWFQAHSRGLTLLALAANGDWPHGERWGIREWENGTDPPDLYVLESRDKGVSAYGQAEHLRRLVLEALGATR